MTITVRVTNTDSRPGAVISVKTKDASGTEGMAQELNGGPDRTGQGQDFLVHSGQSLIVSEVRQP